MKANAIVILIVFAIVGAWVYWVGFANEQTFTTTAYSVEKIEKTHGSKDSFSTDVYYLLSTDNGTFKIAIDGIFAHPEYAGQVKPDSVYRLTVIGQSIPFMGIYPRVKEMHELSKVTQQW